MFVPTIINSNNLYASIKFFHVKLQSAISADLYGFFLINLVVLIQFDSQLINLKLVSIVNHLNTLCIIDLKNQQFKHNQMILFELH